jgi:hypothetical protein
MKLVPAAALLMCLLTSVAFGQNARKSADAEFQTLIDRYYAAWSSL